MSAFKDLLQQAETLLRQTTNGSQSQTTELRKTLRSTGKVRTSGQTLQEGRLIKAKQVATCDTNIVKENPWKAVGIAANGKR